MSTKIDKVNILIKQGATFKWLLNIQDTTGVPIDLTGCHVVMQIRRSVRAPEALVEASTFGNGITLSPLEGEIRVQLTATTTSQLNVEEAVYDMVLLWPDGDVSRIREGNVRVALGVTRSWQAT
jgi:hypothetical protein